MILQRIFFDLETLNIFLYSQRLSTWDKGLENFLNRQWRRQYGNKSKVGRYIVHINVRYIEAEVE